MDIILRNSEDARRLGKEGISFKEVVSLIREFKEFNPFHILPADRAQKYLDKYWNGRALDIQHFGFRARSKKKDAKKEERGEKKPSHEND
jgi:hypothetical protein